MPSVDFNNIKLTLDLNEFNYLFGTVLLKEKDYGANKIGIRVRRKLEALSKKLITKGVKHVNNSRPWRSTTSE